MLLLCIHSHWAVTSLLLLLVRFRAVVVVVDGRPSVASSRARCSNVQRSADYWLISTWRIPPPSSSRISGTAQD